MTGLNSLEIAQSVELKPITQIAEELGVKEDELIPYGKYKAKISLKILERLPKERKAKYILVTAMNPTPFGEGKTTTSIGLTQGLAKLGKKAVVTLREPSMGPVFGIKGGGTGGGYSQVLPMEDINLHFTGDIHAVTSSHNLLAAMIDNHLFREKEPKLDVHGIVWKRVLDMNDRALRNIIVGLGGPKNGIPRETGFDITAASEIMAILALTTGYDDLEKRLGEIIIAYDKNNKAIHARDIKASGAMSVVMKDAIMPNLVQTLEGQPALIHAGPFANIAHGSSSILADKIALGLADYVVTEAGFGADLGAEKFFNIKARTSGIFPDAVVLVVSIRAIKMHGGAFKITPGQKLPEDIIAKEDIEAVTKGFENVKAHIDNLHKFGVPVVVVINKRPTDNPSELETVLKLAIEAGAEKAVIGDPFGKGGEGMIEAAKAVIEAAEMPSNPKPLYDLKLPVEEKIEIIAKEIYGADGVIYTSEAKKDIQLIKENGYNDLPICMAKTQYSLSDNPALLGRPKGFKVTVSRVRLSAGAGFIYPLLGKMLTMPGLSYTPAAENMKLENGVIKGLY